MAESEAQENVEAVETEESTTPQKSSDETQEQEERTSIAEGGESKAEEPEKPYWPEDWREKAAEHASAGDQKAYKRELARLKRVTDPSAMYGMYRELESKFTSGNIIRKPGKDATEEDIAAYRKQLGVPEKPEEYLNDLTLDNGLVLGDDDKPQVEAFAAEMHKVGAPPEAVKTAVQWYLSVQEQEAAKFDEEDDAFRWESERALKEELGPSYKRTINNVANAFTTAPGGADIENENSVYARLLGGRTSDGKIIGNDPDVVRWLSSIAGELNPVATVMDTTGPSGQGIDDRIRTIEKRIREDKRGYFKDQAMQEEYRKLLDVRERMQARAS